MTLTAESEDANNEKDNENAYKEAHPDGVSNFWQMTIKGDFDFSGSDLYKGKDIEITVKGFGEREYESELSGEVTYEKGLIFVMADLAYDGDEESVVGEDASIAVKSGLGFSLALEAGGLSIDKDGFLQNCALSIRKDKEGREEDLKKEEGDDFSFNQIEKNVETRQEESKAEAKKEKTFEALVASIKKQKKAKKASKQPGLKRQNQHDFKKDENLGLKRQNQHKFEDAKETKNTSWGRIEIEAVTLSSEGRNLSINMEGKLYFKIFGKGLAITEFECTTSPAVRLVVEKGKTEAEKEEEEEQENKDKAAGKRPELDFEIESVEVNVDIGDAKNTYFTIKGRASIGVPSFTVKPGRLTIGGNRWGGEFSVVSVNPKWTAEGTFEIDIENTDEGVEISHAISGKLWLGAEKGKKGQSDSEIQLAFTYANDKEKIEVEFKVSKDAKQNVSGFQVTKSGGRMLYEKEDGRWTIGATAGFVKEKLEIEVENLEVQFGGGKAFILRLETVKVVGGDMFEGVGKNLVMDFGNKTFKGGLRAVVDMKGKKLQGEAYWSLDFKYHRYGIGLGITFPIFPAMDGRGLILAGNDIQGVMKIVEAMKTEYDSPKLESCNLEYTSIEAGFYLVVGIEKDWEFEAGAPGVQIEMGVGYKVQGAIGVQVVPPVYAELGFSAGAYLYGRVYIIGIEIASLEAEACLMAKFNIGFKPYYVEGEAKASFRVKGCINIGFVKTCKSASFTLRATKKRNSGLKFKP